MSPQQPLIHGDEDRLSDYTDSAVHTAVPDQHDQPVQSTKGGVNLFPSLWHLLKLTWRIQIASALLGGMTGMISPVLPTVQKTAFGDNAYSVTGSLGAVMGLVSAIMATVVGALSDRIGRRRALGIAVTVALMSWLPMVVYEYDKVFVIAFAFFGFYRPLTSVLFAATADTVRGLKVSASTAMCLPMLAMFVGLMIFTIIGQAVNNHFGIIYVFRIGFIAGVALVAYVFLCLPDVPIVEANNRVSADCEDEITAGVVETKIEDESNTGVADDIEIVDDKAALAVNDENMEVPKSRLMKVAMLVRGAMNRHPSLRYMVPASFFNNIAEQTIFNLAGLFFKNAAGFTPQDQTIMMLVLCFASILSYLIVIPLMTWYTGPVFTLRVSMAANVLVMILIAFARTLLEVCLVLSLVAVSFGVFPCTAAIIVWESEARGTVTKIGLLIGIVAGVRLLAESFAPPLLGMMLNEFQDTSVPGAPFLVCAVAVIIGTVLAMMIPRECDYSIKAQRIVTTEGSSADHAST